MLKGLDLVKLGLCAATLGACGGPSGDVDGVDDWFVAADGKADTGGIADGTPEARGVLRVANEVSLADLRDRVGLAAAAANNIDAYRLGDDGVAGDGDDGTFETLAELDAVPYVGPTAFKKLLAYATSLGWVSTPAKPTPPDSSVPTPAQCLDGWRSLDCAAPIITNSYVSNGCANTTGWFIDGYNFEHLGPSGPNTADYGPQSFGANGNQSAWNVITPNRLCVTVAAGFSSAWVGHTVYVKNPDGKSSNSVVVADRLYLQPMPLPIDPNTPPQTGDPFDPASCTGTTMTNDQALSRFTRGAASAMLGTYQAVVRSRRCNTITGCAAYGSSTNASSLGSGVVRINTRNNSGLWIGVGTQGNEESCGVVGGAMSCSGYYLPDYLTYSGVVTDRCFQVAASRSTTPDSTGSYVETQEAILLTYAGDLPPLAPDPGPSTDPSDPFSAASCTGAAITSAEALSHFAPADSQAALGSYQAIEHTRTCNTATGCTAYGATSSTANLGVGRLALNTQSSSGIWVGVGEQGNQESCGYVGGAMSCAGYYLPDYLTYTGLMTDRCFRVAGSRATSPDGNGSYSETERVILQRF
jgi:hypothetical protein